MKNRILGILGALADFAIQVWLSIRSIFVKEKIEDPTEDYLK